MPHVPHQDTGSELMRAELPPESRVRRRQARAGSRTYRQHEGETGSDPLLSRAAPNETSRLLRWPSFHPRGAGPGSPGYAASRSVDTTTCSSDVLCIPPSAMSDQV